MGAWSEVVVRLKGSSGAAGLSRCRIASTEHMFSMGATATDMIDRFVASTLIGTGERTGDTGGSDCADVDASSRVEIGGVFSGGCLIVIVMVI